LDGFEETNKHKLNAMLTNFFYVANISFVVAQNPSFKVGKRMVEFNRLYTPPLYHDLQHKLLDQAKTTLKAKLHKRTKDNIRKFGATLSIDGWSSVTNWPLINAILISSTSE